MTVRARMPPASRVSAPAEAYISKQPFMPQAHFSPPAWVTKCPSSAAALSCPRQGRPLISSAPPMPVPRVRYTALSRPKHEPPGSVSAASAASASLSIHTGSPVFSRRSAPKGMPNHFRLPELIFPDGRKTEPGTPAPTISAGVGDAESSAAIWLAIASGPPRAVRRKSVYTG